METRRRRVNVSNNSSESHESLCDEVSGVKGSRRVSEANASGESCADDGRAHRASSHSTDGADDDDDLSDSVIIEYEREEGDGQECVPPKEKKLDDDEDRRNPQYIPKRGTFYEHDDRTVAGDEDVEAAPESEVERAAKDGPADKKKVWKEHESKWDHDKYIEDEQAPKSREELVAMYGYDIRCEEGPPRARRRRRYGRGPNKYTRNWEDVEAYGKPAAAAPRRGGRAGRQRGGGRPHGSEGEEEEFPPLAGAGPEEQPAPGGGEVVLRTLTYSSRLAAGDGKGGGGDVFPPLPAEQSASAGCPQPGRSEERVSSGIKENALENVSNAWKKSGGPGRKEEAGLQNASTVRGTEGSRDEEPSGRRKAGEAPHVPTEAPWRGGRGRARQPEALPPAAPPTLRGRGRGLRGSRGRSAVAGRPGRSASETRAPRHGGEGAEPSVNHVWVNSQIIMPTQDDLTKEMSGMLLTEEQPQPNNRDYQRRSKNGQSFQQNGERRQAVVPPRLQDSTANRPKRYSSLRQRGAPEAAGGIAQQPPPPYPQPHGFYQQGYVQQAVYAEAPPQQPSVVRPAATTPPLQLPPAYVQPPPYPPGQPFLPAQVIAAAAAAQAPYPGAPLINYVAPAPPGQFPPPPYPPFQHSFAPVPPGPPAELYQPQGGITYYSPEEQVMARPAPTQKRQRAAIPIVPPPEKAEAVDGMAGGDNPAFNREGDKYEDCGQEYHREGTGEPPPAEQGAQA
ncbi:protein CASC3 [Bacillus rossius redtenbacheri]|uniref:protein CASC3 n=1 Tax=Bacillus rossius redtenbacheri TaxID=93214 RepID=UPI002FDE8736